jgi:tetratricopeptide (TPR) repeat protein
MSPGASNAASLRYCTRCGKQITVGAVFCHACGSPITAPSSEAQDLFEQAGMLSLAKGSNIPAIPMLQRALAIGLAPNDEVFARWSLAAGYREIFGNSGLSSWQMVETNEFRQSMFELERAFELDRTCSLGFFSQPHMAATLYRLDAMYETETKIKIKREGADAALSYLSAKLNLVDYLPRPPLLWSLLMLAALYRDRGAIEDAIRCLHKVIGAKPLSPGDEERYSKDRGKAHQALREIQEQFPMYFQAPVAVNAENCSRCSTAISPGARFCRNCGTAVDMK